MKIINPLGRTPDNEKMNAYGCVCNAVLSNHSAVNAVVPCNACASNCIGSDNSRANQETATNRNY